MAGTVTRTSQAIPVSTASQGVGTVGASGTPLDTTEQPYVFLLDEKDPARIVRPSGVDLPQPVLAAAAPAAFGTLTSTTSVVLASNLGGYTSALITLHGAAWTNLNVVFEGSDDGGMTWYTLWAARTEDALLTAVDIPTTGSRVAYTCSLRGFTTFHVRNLQGPNMTGSADVSIWPLYTAGESSANVRLWDGTDVSLVTPAGALYVSPMGKTTVYPLSPANRDNTTATVLANASTTVSFPSTVDEVLVQNNNAASITVRWGTGVSGPADQGDLQIIGGQNAFTSLDYQATWVSVYNLGATTIPINQANSAGIWITGGTRP